ncbi:acyl-CoA carboxylase subunit beta [Cumulibacter soli]|uniref:acyl-CoA carboxylase subunit beta n=1 Tax=Cumulibacter soli TaxID=2546344 RepID=UPI0010683562|nr:carboxyl transferase domain-containing protein [Cumulibacter soli]
MSVGRRESGSVAEGWRPEVERINSLRQRALEMGGQERIDRQHARGKLTARERMDLLFDRGTMEEIGILADHAGTRRHLKDFHAPADGVVTASGLIDGRPAFAFSEDFTVLGGSTGSVGIQKRNRLKELAGRERLPIVYLLDGAGARGQEAILAGWPDSSHFLVQSRLAGIVPQVGAVLGGLGGDPALEVPLCDFKIMSKGEGALFTGGPPLVKAALGLDIDKIDLGGYKIAVETAGVVDNAAEDDADAIAQIRRYLSYMPLNCDELPPVVAPTDDPWRADDELLDIVPRNRRAPYDMQQIVDRIVDHDSVFQIQPTFGKSLITCLARMDGHVVGIVANQPKVRAGAMTGDEADKAVHFISLCNSFNIPMVFLVDVPGLMVGPETERQAILKRGLRVAWVTAHARVPNVTVLIRKAYGMGAAAMNGPGGGQSATLCWPSAEFGSLPVAGGVDAAFKSQIAGGKDASAVRAEFESSISSDAGPFPAAGVFNFDELIDPRETRARVVRAFRRARRSQERNTGPWQHYGLFP